MDCIFHVSGDIMKHNFKAVSLLCVLSLFLSGCALTPLSTFKYEYPEERLLPSANSSIAIVYPEDKRRPDGENDIIWSDDPVKEIEKVIQAEIKSTGLFREVFTVDKDEIIESGVRVVLYTSVMLLAWDVPFPLAAEDMRVTDVTDLYGKVKIKVTLVDQDTGQNLIDKEYYSSVRKTMSYLRTDLYGPRQRVIWQALKEVMGQLKTDLKKK